MERRSGREKEGAVVEIPLEDLLEPSRDVRQTMDEEALLELADSIKRLGILNPLIVRPVEDGKYEIVAGHRRYIAAHIAGLEKVPCIVRNYNELDTMIARIHENVKREDLNPADTALLVKKMRDDHAYSYEEIGEFFGKSGTWAAKFYKIGGADPEILDALRQGQITPSHVDALMDHPSREKRLYFLKILLDAGGSVKAVRMWVAQDLGYQEQIKELQPTRKVADEKPYLRDIKGRCASCWQETYLDQMYRVLLCPECYEVFMNEIRQLHSQNPRVMDYEIPEERRKCEDV